MHHAPGCLELKTILHVCQVLLCNFYSVALSPVISAANPLPFMCHDRRKNKENSFRQLIPKSSILFQQWLLLPFSDIYSHEGEKGECLHVTIPEEGYSSRGEAGKSAAGAVIVTLRHALVGAVLSAGALLPPAPMFERLFVRWLFSSTTSNRHQLIIKPEIVSSLSLLVKGKKRNDCGLAERGDTASS